MSVFQIIRNDVTKPQSTNSSIRICFAANAETVHLHPFFVDYLNLQKKKHAICSAILSIHILLFSPPTFTTPSHGSNYL